MLRLSKKLDYSLIILGHLARLERGQVASARAIADEFGLPLPITSSLLKTLVSHEIVGTVRGINGGHSLRIPPASLSLAMIAEAIDGPLKLADCIRDPGDDGCEDDRCAYEDCCPVISPVKKVHGVLKSLFAGITLSHLLGDRPIGAVYLSWESNTDHEGPSADRDFATSVRR